MDPIHDSCGLEDAATEKTAETGGNGTKEPARSGAEQSAAPRSWRQYIEQNLSAGDTDPEAEPRDGGVRRTAPDGKEAARAGWNRFTGWVQEGGRRARSAAARCQEKLRPADACLEKLNNAAIACGKKLNNVSAAAQEKLNNTAAAARKKLEPAAVAVRKKLDPVAAAAREKLEPAAARCREKLGPRAEKFRDAVARHPVSPLLYVTLLAVVIGVVAFQGSYARAYVLEVNGQKVGLVSDEAEANTILGNVETRAATLLGGSFDYEVTVTLSPVYAAPGAIADAAEVEDALLEEMGAYLTVHAEPDPEPTDASPGTAEEEEPPVMTAWVLSVDGEELGYFPDKDQLYRLLDEVAQPWLPENTLRYEFVEDVQIYSVELPADARLDGINDLREELNTLRVEEALYTVKSGDTFSGIAEFYSLSIDELSALNPDVTSVNLLWVDQQLVVQRAVPRLSVTAVTEVTYEQVVPSPVEYIETPNLYVGSTQLMQQGEDGLALVDAQVTYLNGAETNREILESTTLKEATTTYTYTGTTPRPVTASTGYFIWPVSGPISSLFGGRYIWGVYDFHLGLDIAVPSGSTIKAADGGTVVTAGWSGSYGILVVIRHDNGMLTYYGHNSSVLVGVGQKVYQGQPIAVSGATGNVTGPHCHFEIRVNGTCVNPLNYLS